MTLTVSRSTTTARRQRRPGESRSGPARPNGAARRRATCARRRVLERYTDPAGNLHELTAQPGAAGTVLVLDRSARVPAERRLVAHLAADEPVENAALVCALYLEDARRGAGGCRRVREDDMKAQPFAEQDPRAPIHPPQAPVDRRGYRYRIEPRREAASTAQLRWCVRASAHAQPLALSVRDVVARLERYEPVCAVTRDALGRHRAGPGISTTVLRGELRRLEESPILLNRRLRAAVLETMGREGVSMSALATRCGRVKIDRKGHASGETSWLARRLGMLPEAGHSSPTPWIHSDVLALIAREGLGICPRDVEADCHEPWPAGSG